MTVMPLSRGFKDDFHSDAVLSILNEQRIRGVLCDVTIIVEDTKFKAHSNVLAASSLYFKNIFWGHTICISSHVLQLDGLKAEVFTEILNYIYSSTVVVKRQETVTDLAAAGKRLGISFLEDLTDRSFSSSPGPYVFCITERGVVKEEKNEKRHEEPAVTSGPRITNAFSIVETENSNNMFSPLDLRASFKKVSDAVRSAGLCPERADGRLEAGPVRTLAEHSYAVSAVPGAPRSQPSGGGPPGGAGVAAESGEAPAAQPHACGKPKTACSPGASRSAAENAPPPAPAAEAAQGGGLPGAQGGGLPGTQGGGLPGAQGEGLPGTQGGGLPGTQGGELPGTQGEGLPGAQGEGLPGAQGEGLPGAQGEGLPGAGAGDGGRPAPMAPGPPTEGPALLSRCGPRSFGRALLGAHEPRHRPAPGRRECRRCNGRQASATATATAAATATADGQGLRCEPAGPAPPAPAPALALPAPALLPARAAAAPAPAPALPGAPEHEVRWVDGRALFGCAACPRSYASLSSLRRHANVHSWRRTYPCHFCGRVFALAEYRTRHEVWHTGERRYQCVFCLETFMTYYILKNHQKSFHAIDHGLPLGRKAANGLKPAAFPCKLYRLLPMKCRRAPIRGPRRAAGPCALGALDALGALPAGLAGLPAFSGQGGPAGPAWAAPALTVGAGLGVPPGGHAPSPSPPASAAAPPGGPGSVISYGGPAPSVIVHGGHFPSVIVHGPALAAAASSGHTADPNPAPAPAPAPDPDPDPDPASRPLAQDGPPEADRAPRLAGRPRGKERKKTAPSRAGEPPGEARCAPAPAPAPAPPSGPRGAGKTETYIAKPALPGASSSSGLAPLCQITVKIGNEAIVKRHILGSKLFCKRGRRPKEPAPQDGASPPGPGQPEGADGSEAPDDASDQDSSDKPWRPYYNYKPKKKSRQWRKTRRAGWRKEPAEPRPGGGRGKDPRLDPGKHPGLDPRLDPGKEPRLGPRLDPHLDPSKDPRLDPSKDPRLGPRLDPDGAWGRPPAEQAAEEERAEMPTLRCELCHAGGPGPGRPHRHPAARRHECALCGKRFQSPSTLRMHVRSHTGERPFACRTCGRRFSAQGNLQKHERIHLGLKEFVCQYCHKAFTLSETLKIHERIHTGEKRYRCQFCLQSFLYLSTKRNHEQRHLREHSGKGFACVQCPKVCKTAAALGMHQKKHLFKGPAPQKAGRLCRESASPAEDSDRKDHVQAVVGNVLLSSSS